MLPATIMPCHPLHAGRLHISLQAAVVASPPTVPVKKSSLVVGAVSDVFSACRSLQSLVLSHGSGSRTTGYADVETAGMALPLSRFALYSPSCSLSSPPLTLAAPPRKLRLRKRAAGLEAPAARMKLASRAASPPYYERNYTSECDAKDRCGGMTGQNTAGDDANAGDAAELFASARPSLLPAMVPLPAIRPVRRDVQSPGAVNPPTLDVGSPQPRPETPKQSRISPEVVPLGLTRADFHQACAERGGAAANERTRGQGAEPSAVDEDEDGMGWTAEDDQMLIEIVLEKLRLSPSDWQDCARTLGKGDRHGVSRRWRSMVLAGDIGLRPGRAGSRARLHATWR